MGEAEESGRLESFIYPHVSYAWENSTKWVDDFFSPNGFSKPEPLTVASVIDRITDNFKTYEYNYLLITGVLGIIFAYKSIASFIITLVLLIGVDQLAVKGKEIASRNELSIQQKTLYSVLVLLVCSLTGVAQNVFNCLKWSALLVTIHAAVHTNKQVDEFGHEMEST